MINLSATSCLAFASIAAAGLSSTNVDAQNIQSTRADLDVQLALEIGRTIGQPNYIFGDISAIAVSSSSDILVLDRMAGEVRRYSSSGRFMGAFGREGSGPGEFIRPTSMALRRGAIWVDDSALRRVSHFTPDGELIRTRDMFSPPGLPMAHTVALRGDVIIGMTIARFAIGGPPGRHQPENVIFAAQMGEEAIDTLLVRRSGGTIWYIEGRVAPWGSPPPEVARYAPGGFWAVSGDSLVAVVDGYESTVKWYRIGPNGLNVIRTAKLSIESTPVTESDIERIKSAVRQKHQVEGHRLPSRGLRIGAPPRRSSVRGALFSDAGDLWIDVRDESEGVNAWLVLGRLRNSNPRRIRVPEGFRLEAVHGRKLYGVARTELDVQIVRVYRIGDAEQ